MDTRFDTFRDQTFRQLHADWYDRFHRRKAYPVETDQIRAAFDQAGGVDSVLDLGCGTGRHLELLAAAGYAVTGVDRSPSMAAAARARLAPFGPRATVLESDLLALEATRRFDAVIMMFALISYQVSNAATLAVLRAAHGQLRPGGVLVLDLLDAGSVLTGPARDGGLAAVADGERELLCAYTDQCRADEQVSELTLRMWLLEGGRVVDEDTEVHPLRYFLPREMDLLLEVAGFHPLGSAALAGEDAPAGRETFRLAWARARTETEGGNL